MPSARNDRTSPEPMSPEAPETSTLMVRLPSVSDVRLESALLEPCPDGGEKSRGLPAVDQPLIVREGEVDDGPNRDGLPKLGIVDDNRAFDDRADAQHADLRRHENRCVEQNPMPAGIRQCE